MLTSYSQKQILEKIMTDSFGRQYRVVFEVACINGEVKGRIVSAVSIPLLDGEVKNNSNSLCLPQANFGTNKSDTIVTINNNVVSPYVSLEFLIKSQPTRAPSSTKASEGRPSYVKSNNSFVH